MNFLNLPKESLLALFYIYVNMFSILILTLLYIKNRKNKETQSFYINSLIVSSIIYFIFDVLWALSFYKLIPNNEIIIRITRIFNYTILAFLGYLWFIYINIVLGTKLVYEKKIKRLLYIPICIASLYSIIMCSFFDPSLKNIYGYLLAFSLCLEPFTFVIIAGVMVLIKQTQLKDSALRKRYINIAFWPIILIVVSVIQLFVAELPILCLGSTIVVLALYIYNQDSLIFTDSLTHIYNRKMLNRYINNDLDDSNTYYVLMIDIDKFKSINDTKGHLEGDKALKYLARLLNSITSKQGDFLARYGGDEFIIIAKNKTEDDIKELINLVNEKTKNTLNDLGYSFTASIGYSILENKDKIEEAIEKADTNLYNEKEIHHKKR